jgi:hypothetical protein
MRRMVNDRPVPQLHMNAVKLLESGVATSVPIETRENATVVVRREGQHAATECMLPRNGVAAALKSGAQGHEATHCWG